MTRELLISRRTVLKGLGTAIALPLLEGMLPAVSRGEAAAGRGRGNVAGVIGTVGA